MNRRVMIVAAHTDDEVLGCGGTIARHVAEGDTVYAAFLADGVMSRLDASSAELEERNSAAAKAHQILGMERAYMLSFPDNRMDSVPLLDIIQKLEEIICEVQPQIVYTHHSGDLNIDHCITHQAVITACRPVPGASVKEIYAFEVLSSTEWGAYGHHPFTPDVFVDIGKYWNQKSKALNAYALEMRQPPHSRSIEHMEILSRHRGSNVGIEQAEAFKIIRMLK